MSFVKCVASYLAVHRRHLTQRLLSQRLLVRNTESPEGGVP